MKLIKRYCIVALFLVSACSSIRTNTEFYDPIMKDLQQSKFNDAALKIEVADQDEEYADKDRVLKYLDKGIIYHYKGNYNLSNEEFEKAEYAIEELYTKSISKGAASILLNDNALDYRGEVYEDLYINVFKALNYIHLNEFDGAYVEINRINNKLKELDTKYEEYLANLNKSEDQKFEIPSEELEYFNNVLANYLSHLIMRADGNIDGSRISLENLNNAWETYNDVYDYSKPDAVVNTSTRRSQNLNIIAFVGPAPQKVPVGARITTFDDFVTVSDPTNFYTDAIPFPGIEYGWNFKFEFPEMEETGTFVNSVEIEIDSVKVGELQLLENMCNVARKTFETEKSITYFKTITRAVLKGVGASSLGREIKKEADGIFGDILTGVVNAAVDATENADLRCWRTMPGYSFIGEFPIEEGKHTIKITFYDDLGRPLKEKIYRNYKPNDKINLLEAVYLN